VIDDCVSEGTEHLIFDEDGINVNDSFLGGYDICGECNGDGFSCSLEATGGVNEIQLNWWGPNSLSLEGLYSNGRGSNNRSDPSESAVFTHSSAVELEIDSETVVVNGAGAGTLDIVMQNYPGCQNFCFDPKENEASSSCFINGEYVNGIDEFGNIGYCFGEDRCMDAEGEWYEFVREDEVDETECSEFQGTWFDGYVGGFQFELLGITIDDATAPDGFTVQVLLFLLEKGFLPRYHSPVLMEKVFVLVRIQDHQEERLLLLEVVSI